jgi:hypothetical protein
MNFTITKEKLETFKGNLKALSRKLGKVLSFEITKEYKIELDTIASDSDGEKYKIGKHDVWMLDIEVSNLDEIKYSINGFEFYAEVKSIDGMGYVFSMDNLAFQNISQDTVFKCHHCGKVMSNRKNKIYLKKDGQLYMFGSSCVTEYFGDAFKEIAKNCGLVSQFMNESMSLKEDGDSQIEFLKTISRLIYCYKTGEKYDVIKGNFWGLVSADKDFCKAFFDNNYDKMYAAMNDNKELVETICDLWENKEPENNFENNLRDMYRISKVVSGLLTFSVYKYFWNLEEKKLAKVLKYLDAEIGSEIKNLEVTLEKVNSFEGQYGPTYFNQFITANNEIIISKNSYSFFKDNTFDYAIGQKYIISKAKVVEKKMFRDYPQTIIKVSRQVNFQKV